MVEMESASSRPTGDDLNDKVILFVQVSLKLVHMYYLDCILWIVDRIFRDCIRT